jgi:hypothetical protein
MRKIKFIAIMLLVSVFFIACAGEMAPESSDESMADSNGAPMQSSQVAKEAPSDDIVDGDKSDGSTANPENQVSLEDAQKTRDQEPAKATERKIIRNAQLQLETDSPEESQQKITAIANNKNGFVITSTQRNTNAKAKGRNSVSMQIRVPADKFQESLDEIRKTADRVLVETVSGKDVTEEFVDIEARLKTKKALEERFLEIMKTAKTVQDALNVERQLASVRTEIERIEGRKRFLESQTSLSTINIELQTPVAISASSTGFFYEVKEAISDGFEAALTFILFLIRVLIAILPFLILIVLPVLLLLRYFWRRSKKNRAARRILEEELKEDQIIDVE